MESAKLDKQLKACWWFRKGKDRAYGEGYARVLKLTLNGLVRASQVSDVAGENDRGIAVGQWSQVEGAGGGGAFVPLVLHAE